LNRSTLCLVLAAQGCAHSPQAAPPPPPVEEPLDVPVPKQRARGAQGQGLITSCRVGAIFQRRGEGATTDFVPGNHLEDLPDNTEVTVAGSYAGWILVKEAWNAEAEDRTWPEGWVHGSFLTTELEAPVEGQQGAPLLYEFPNRDADAFEIDLEGYVLTVVGCHDLFLAVRVTYPDARPDLYGWLFAEDHCPSTVTTCP